MVIVLDRYSEIPEGYTPKGYYEFKGKLYKFSNEIVKDFENILSTLEISNIDVYYKHGEEFLYHKGKDWYIYLDLKNGDFWVNYYRLWYFFETKYSMEFEKIQALCKYMVEEELKRNVGTPLYTDLV